MRLLQTTNGVVQTVAASGYANLGAITRRVGCNANCPTFSYNGTNLITLNTPGYYEVDISADITSTSATQQSIISIIQDGVAVSTLSDYATVAGEISTKSRILIIRVFCNNNTSLALQNTGGEDVLINNLNIAITKIA